MRRRGRAIAAAVALLTLPAVAGAQARLGKGSVEVSGGITYIGGYSFDERTAEQTANSGSTGAPFDFFTTDSEIKPVVGYRARLGYFFSRSLSIEGGLRFAKPVYEVRITDDFENAPDSTAEEDLSQYLFDGSLVYHFGSGSDAPRRSSTAAPATCASCTKARPWSRKVSSITPAAASRCGSAAAASRFAATSGCRFATAASIWMTRAASSRKLALPWCGCSNG